MPGSQLQEANAFSFCNGHRAAGRGHPDTESGHTDGGSAPTVGELGAPGLINK